jgi:hypothetical protein
LWRAGRPGVPSLACARGRTATDMRRLLSQHFGLRAESVATANCRPSKEHPVHRLEGLLCVGRRRGSRRGSGVRSVDLGFCQSRTRTLTKTNGAEPNSTLTRCPSLAGEMEAESSCSCRITCVRRSNFFSPVVCKWETWLSAQSCPLLASNNLQEGGWWCMRAQAPFAVAPQAARKPTR